MKRQYVWVVACAATGVFGCAVAFASQSQNQQIATDNQALVAQIPVQTVPLQQTSTISPSAAQQDDALSIVRVITKLQGMPASFVPPDLVPIGGLAGEDMLRRVAAENLRTMFDAAALDGVRLKTNSAYRSYHMQQTLYQQMSVQIGDVSERAAQPGHSEHQLGLAADITGGPGTSASTAYAWLATHAAEHGFIVRYPKDKTHITGYEYEPWHVRYVGRSLAAEATANHKTLEEFFAVPGH